MKTLMRKLKTLFRLFKYVKTKDAFFYLIQKFLDNHVVPVTFKDGTHTNVLSMSLLNFLPSKKQVIPLENDLFLWNICDEKWVASYEQIIGLSEYVNRDIHTFYSAQYENKVVLDIGGFIGDTAQFFIKNGAKKVIIFEPVKKNVTALFFNLQDHKDKVVIYQKALNKSDGEMILCSMEKEGSASFGFEKGPHQLTCHGMKIDSILALDQIDIVKIDCEGGERHLLSADEKVLEKVNEWMIETHDFETHQNMIHKFCNCGFNMMKQFYVAKDVHVIHFNKNSV